MALKIDYKNDIVDGSRKYRMINNSDDTISLEDVTEYIQQGDNFNANDVNKTNEQVNANQLDINNHIADKSNPHSVTASQLGLGNVDNTRDSNKRVAYAENAGISDEFSKDFILANKRSLSFSNMQCRIDDSRITASSLADVYFTSETMEAATNSFPEVETYDGYLIISIQRTPEKTLYASIRVRVV
ncbi:MAG: hypothetical protein MJ236_00820 [Clostridia bacterium]|nr:hypothetical protein [Clostridia bacterium]